ncbi:MAG: TraB/GumN family protein [Chitinophaga sp.]|uniref:TraB/GumN family protein n=1 Tax=Chitinophaga sp. TaxID=1869181 RepID=UPI0025BD832C|nr:TraB/GumN family protein [Chitinophaga sp.]MBV8255499.1 TraB/GumN family protein [Chitinophaga sp.]
MLSTQAHRATPPLQATRTKMMPAIIACFLMIMCNIQSVSAQSRSKYQLLWRIDGPGIKQSSYLYGSMHLRDPRVFEFSDSVLLAFHQARNFATEVDMDSLMTSLIDANGPLQDTTNHLRKQLNKEEYRFIDSLIFKKAGIHISQMRVKTVWVIEKLLLDQEEALISEQKNTQRQGIFLDGWFHEKAAILNKKLMGLEPISNQYSLFKSAISDVDKQVFLAEMGYYNSHASGDMFTPPVGTPDKVDKNTPPPGPPPIVETLAPNGLNPEARYLDSMVSLYYTGDLDKITHWFIDAVDPTSEEGKWMEKRNQDMTASIIRQMPKGGLFAVVGVGHLTGKNSILQLLRKKGYTVTPVTATFTGVAAKYKDDYEKLGGYTLHKLAEGYTVVLPGAPYAYPIPGSNTKMYFSVNEAAAEAAFAFSMSNIQTGSDAKGIRLNMIKGMATKAGSMPANLQEIQYMDVAGTQADISGFGALYRARVFVRNGKGYLFMHTVTAEDSSKAIKFFNSVRFNDIAVTTTTYGTLNLNKVGISFKFPEQYQSFNVGNATHMDVGGRYEEVHSASDAEKGITFTFSGQRMLPGYYITNDSLILADLKKGILLRDSLVQFTEENIHQEHGLKTITYRLTGSNIFHGSLKVIYRGNNVYSFITQYPGDVPPAPVKEFMDNYSLTPLPATSLNTTFTAEDSSFTLKGPVEYAPYTGKIPNNGTGFYYAYDPTSEGSYMVLEKKFGEYTSSDPYTLINKEFTPASDTLKMQLLNEKKYKQDGMYVYEVTYKPRHSNCIRMFKKIIIAGHHGFMFTALLTDDAVKAGLDKAFLSSIAINKAHIDTLDIQSDKKQELIKHLQSTDTLQVKAARTALWNITPDNNLLHQIHQLIFQDLPLNRHMEGAPLKLNLYNWMTRKDYTLANADDVAASDNQKENATAIAHLTSAEKIAAVKQLMKEAQTLHERQLVVRCMSGINSEEGYQLCIQNASALPKDSLNWRGTFQFNLPKKLFYEKHLPDLIQTASTSPNLLAYLSTDLPDSLWNSPYYEKCNLGRLKSGLVKLYDEERMNLERKKESSSTNAIQLMKVLSKPNLAEGNAPLLRRMLADTISMSDYYGALGLMNTRQKVADKDLKALIANDSHALWFIQKVATAKQLAVINPFLTAERIAALQVKDYFNEDEEVNTVDTLQLVKTKTIDTLSYFIYKYTCQYESYQEDVDTSITKRKSGYILCGGQPVKGTNWNLENPTIKKMGSQLGLFTDAFLTSFIKDDITIKEDREEETSEAAPPSEAPPVRN